MGKRLLDDPVELVEVVLDGLRFCGHTDLARRHSSSYHSPKHWDPDVTKLDNPDYSQRYWQFDDRETLDERQFVRSRKRTRLYSSALVPGSCCR